MPVVRSVRLYGLNTHLDHVLVFPEAHSHSTVSSQLIETAATGPRGNCTTPRGIHTNPADPPRKSRSAAFGVCFRLNSGVPELALPFRIDGAYTASPDSSAKSLIVERLRIVFHPPQFRAIISILTTSGMCVMCHIYRWAIWVPTARKSGPTRTLCDSLTFLGDELLGMMETQMMRHRAL